MDRGLVEEKLRVQNQRRKLAGDVVEHEYSGFADLDYLLGEVDPETGDRSGDGRLGRAHGLCHMAQRECESIKL